MSAAPEVALAPEGLLEFIVSQRWSGANDREPVGLNVLDHGVVRAKPLLIDALVEVRYGPGTHDVFQLLVGSNGHGVTEALDDPAMARALVDLMRAGAAISTVEGTIEYSASGSLLDTLTASESRPMTVEQSNTSVVVDERAIVKAYRRLDAGINPELEMLRFLGSHGFSNVPELGGWWVYSGPSLNATLGTVQRLVPDAVDGWSLALAELGMAPEAFIERLERLGQVIGEMHVTLAGDADDPAFAPEEAGPEALSLLAATMDDEIDQVFTRLPDLESVAPIAGCGDALRDLARSLAEVGTTGRLIRQHGDLHLGQLLWSEGDWTVVDFEGEPARPLLERRRKRSPLRDVAGMLRSFAYAARVADLDGDELEEQATETFLTAYLETAQSAGILPGSVETTRRLLEIFALEKAVYELRYELAHRPDWVRIPVAGIERLLERNAG